MAMNLRSVIAFCVAGASLCLAEPVNSATIVDPSGDILSTYVGQVGPELDILQFSVTLQGQNLVFDIVLGGAPTALSRYAIGVNRGGGTNQFGEEFRAGTSFDTTISIVAAAGTGEIRFLAAAPPVPSPILSITPLPAGSIALAGSSVTTTVPLNLLPSSGFNPADYTFVLWSRTNVGPGIPPMLGIADFAPDQGMVALVPETSSWVMLLIGFGAIGVVARHRRKREVASGPRRNGSFGWKADLRVALRTVRFLDQPLRDPPQIS